MSARCRYCVSLIFILGTISKAEYILSENAVLSNILASGIFNNVSLENAISEKCNMELNLWRESVKNKEVWALQMFDATAKIQSGLLEGNIYNFGAFDECLAVENITVDILGKYCLLALPLVQNQSTKLKARLMLVNKNKFYFALCFPQTCSNDDIQELLLHKGFNLSDTEIHCQTKEDFKKSFDKDAIIVLCFFGVVLTIIGLSTVYECITLHFKREDTHLALVTFSIVKNVKKIFFMSENPNEISCLNGVRVLTMSWIVLSHLIIEELYVPSRNDIEKRDWLHNGVRTIAIGAFLASDTFLLVSGLMISYTFLLLLQRGHKLNIPLLYLHRILRLSPLSNIVLIIYIFLVQYMGSGPLWPMGYEQKLEMCKKTWWKAVLYIQNYGDVLNACLPHYWYLAVDTQLYVLSPILLLPLQRWPIVAVLLACVFLTCSIVAGFAVTWYYEIGVRFFDYDTYNFFTYYYMAVYTRAGPWLIGFVLGCLIFKHSQTKDKVYFSKTVQVTFWIGALITMVLCIQYGYSDVLGEVTILQNSFDNSLRRPAWSIALGWLIYSCHFNCGGIINKFLSLPFFKVLSKLTYCSYLIHLPIIQMINNCIRVTQYASYLQLFFKYCGIMVLTLCGSIVLSLSFEVPMISIEKLLLKKV